MSGHRRSRCLPVVAALTLVVIAGGAPSAVAHTHPTPIESAAPGVVFVEARAKVEVALIEHRTSADEAGVHIGVAQSTWNPVLATASGFVVDPNGAIVTTGSVVRPDLERAKVYAVNQAFAKAYGATGLTKDPFTRHHIGAASDRNEQRLQGCYPPHKINDAGGCIVKASLDLVVYPYVYSQTKYGTLRAEVLSTSRDVAALRVRGANSWPTVAVAQSAAGASALGVLGFTGVPGPKHPIVEVNQHLAKAGAAELKTVDLTADDVKDAARLKVALAQGIAGGPVVAERGQVIGLLPGPVRAGQPAPDLVGVAAILPVLKAAGVTPHAGPVDTSYESAMHLFKNGKYAAAVPGFKNALQLFPGHYRARANLAIAEDRAKAGGGNAAPVPGAPAEETAPADGFPWLLAAGIGLATLMLAAIVLALVRRSRSSGGAAGDEAPPPPRTPVAAGAPARAAASATPSRAGAPPRNPRPAGQGPGTPRSGNAGVGHPGPAGSAAAGTGVAAAGVAGAGLAGAGMAGAGTAGPRAATPGAGAGPGGDRARVPSAGAKPSPSVQASRPVTPGQAPSVQQASRAAASEAGFRFCTSCGGRLAAQHQFCGWCGEPVG